MKITNEGRRRLESPDFKHVIVLFAHAWKPIALNLAGMEMPEYLLSLDDFISRMVAHVAMGHDPQTFEEMAHRQTAFIDANRQFVIAYFNGCRRVQIITEAFRRFLPAYSSYRIPNEAYDPSTPTMRVMLVLFMQLMRIKYAVCESKVF